MPFRIYNRAFKVVVMSFKVFVRFAIGFAYIQTLECPNRACRLRFGCAVPGPPPLPGPPRVLGRSGQREPPLELLCRSSGCHYSPHGFREGRWGREDVFRVYVDQLAALAVSVGELAATHGAMALTARSGFLGFFALYAE